jgi:hypothetical protein
MDAQLLVDPIAAPEPAVMTSLPGPFSQSTISKIGEKNYKNVIYTSGILGGFVGFGGVLAVAIWCGFDGIALCCASCMAGPVSLCGFTAGMEAGNTVATCVADNCMTNTSISTSPEPRL